MLTFIAFLIVIGTIILVHEAGHFLAARLVGIKVREFSIGMGKEIICKKIGETLYCVRWIPIGGYVILKGLVEDEEQEQEEDELTGQDSYATKSWWQKLLVLLAGGIMNLLLAIFILFLNNWLVSWQYPVLVNLPVVKQVVKNMPAFNLLKSKDKIIEINGIKIDYWYQIKQVLSELKKDSIVNLKVSRNSKIVDLKLKLKDGKLGIVADDDYYPILGYISGINPISKYLKNADYLLEINGRKILTLKDFLKKFNELKKQGKEIKLKVLRFDVKSKKYIEKVVNIPANLQTVYFQPDYAAVLNIMREKLEKIGLKNGDLILSINGVKVYSWFSIVNILKAFKNQKVRVKVFRISKGKAKVMEFGVPIDKNGKMGIATPTIALPPMNAKDSIIAAFETVKQMTAKMLSWFASLFVGKASVKDVSGPIGLIRVIKHGVHEGLSNFLFIFAMISLNIGLLNLFPFPALDGGRSVFVVLRAMKLKISQELEEKIHTVGIYTLLLLLLLVSIKDIKGVFS